MPKVCSAWVVSFCYLESQKKHFNDLYYFLPIFLGRIDPPTIHIPTSNATAIIEPNQTMTTVYQNTDEGQKSTNWLWTNVNVN